MHSSAPKTKPNGVGIKRICRASLNAVAGLQSCWKNEAAFRQEVICCLVLYPLLFIFDITPVEKALLFASLTLVLLTELVNSAIETTIDRIGMDYHPLSGRAKDMGAAAVFMSILLTTGVWLCVLAG
ncbi:diacylglycerol kinase [Vreelandella aquamarina]